MVEIVEYSDVARYSAATGVYTFSDCFPGEVFLEQTRILQQLVSISDSESVLSLSLGIISSGSFILTTRRLVQDQ